MAFVGLNWVWKGKSPFSLALSSKNTSLLLLRSVLCLKLLRELQIKTFAWGWKW